MASELACLMAVGFWQYLVRCNYLINVSAPILYMLWIG